MKKVVFFLLFFALGCTQQREQKTYNPVNPSIPQNLSYEASEKTLRYQEVMNPIYPTFSGSDGSIPSFSISPALPTGLQFSATTGRIAGTPEALSSSRVYTVTVTNNTGSASTNLVLSVVHQAPFNLSYGNNLILSSMGGLINVVPLCAEGIRMGAGCTSFSISPALPSFLSFNTTSGRISGIVSSRFTQTYTITGYNTGGSTSTDVTIDIRQNIYNISLGVDHSCAIVDGISKCWGRNDHGQVGDGTQVNKLSPVSINYSGSRFANISLGLDFSCAYRFSDFQAYCWGNNPDGAFGPNVALTSSLVPLDLNLVIAGINVSQGSSLRRLCGLNDQEQSLCYGAYDFGSLVSTNYRVRENSSTNLSPISAISSGGDFACFLKFGRVYCHGNNSVGQLGDNQASGSSSFYTVTPVGLESGVTALDSFGRSACAIKNNQNLYCWGEINGAVEPTLMTIDILDSISIDSLSVGQNFLCLKNMSRVYCIGDNSVGQLGRGSADANSVSFVEVKKDNDEPLGNVQQLELGGAHACAIASNEVFCWGKNDQGQLGIGSVVNSNKAKKLNF